MLRHINLPFWLILMKKNLLRGSFIDNLKILQKMTINSETGHLKLFEVCLIINKPVYCIQTHQI